MAINFTYYPDSNRVPGVYVEMDPSQANTAQTLQRSLLIGQILSTGAATPEEPVEVQSLAQIQTLCGRGSILAQMAQAYLAGDNFGDLWLLPFEDAAAGAAATGTVTFGGTATAPGTINLYIGGINVRVGVDTGDSAGSVASATLAAMATYPDIAVTGTVTAPALELTAKNKGLTGNDIQLMQNYQGAGGRRVYAGRV